ncbi:MAG TPA: hypothetical protein VFN50_08000 [Acidimicrobiales bacterium]|nr:hypothetical protein [Acidimicrobiales bacterium]
MPLAARPRRRGLGDVTEPQALSIAHLRLRPPSERPTRRGGRRPHLVVLGVAVVVVCAGVGAELAHRSNARSAYLEVTRALPAGALVRPDDLSEVELGLPPGFAAVPAADEGALTASRTVGPLVPGTLLVAGDLVRSLPRSGTALVGASLQPDQMPATLEPGDAVWLVLSAAGTGSASGPASTSVSAPAPGDSARLGRGTVFALGTGPSSSAAVTTGGEEVTVAVPESEAPAAAVASAAGTLSLVQVPLGPAGGGSR